MPPATVSALVQQLTASLGWGAFVELVAPDYLRVRPIGVTVTERAHRAHVLRDQLVAAGVPASGIFRGAFSIPVALHPGAR